MKCGVTAVVADTSVTNISNAGRQRPHPYPVPLISIEALHSKLKYAAIPRGRGRYCV